MMGGIHQPFIDSPGDSLNSRRPLSFLLYSPSWRGKISQVTAFFPILRHSILHLTAMASVRMPFPWSERQFQVSKPCTAFLLSSELCHASISDIMQLLWNSVSLLLLKALARLAACFSMARAWKCLQHVAHQRQLLVPLQVLMTQFSFSIWVLTKQPPIFFFILLFVERDELLKIFEQKFPFLEREKA